MSTGTGFFLGVGSVALALTVGFAGGYVLTAPDETQKVPAAAYSKHRDTPPPQPTETKHEAPPPVVASVPEHSSPASVVSTEPTNAATTALAAPLPPPKADVAAPPPPATSGVIQTKVNQPQAIESPAPEKIVAKGPKKVAQSRPKIDMGEIRRAVVNDARRRGLGVEAVADVDAPGERGGLLSSFSRD